MSGHSNKRTRIVVGYSITSSARASSVGGIVIPIACAALTLYHQIKPSRLFDRKVVSPGGRIRPWQVGRILNGPI